jgi:hypothetical protein
MTELELLEKRIWRSGLQDVLVGVVIFVMALGVLAGAVTKWNDPAGKPWFMLVLGPIFVWVAWLMASGGRRQLAARTTRLYLAASGDAKDVAWVHLTVGSVNAMKVHFIDGEITTVHGGRKDLERMLAFMMQRAPGAIFGFGKEQLRQYTERVRTRQR